MPKFRRATPPNSEVISAPLLHFKPIFDLLLRKIVRGPPSLVGGALVRLGHSLARVKIWGPPLGAEIWFSEKCVLGGTISHLNLQGHWTELHLLVSPNAGGIAIDGMTIRFRFWRYSPPNFEVVQNRAKFYMFFAPEIFLGCAPQNFGPAL